MKLVCYPTSGAPPRIVAAPVERDWMDNTGAAFAYRCLPLNIANAHGWLILNDAPFVAQWNGAESLDAIRIEAVETEGASLLASSHFGNGVLTFHINGLFRTEPEYDLWVTGPTNMVKDGIQPLTGIVETDWSPFTFTMNWLFTRKNAPIAFERDEPMCMIFPLPRGLIERVEPEFQLMELVPEVEGVYRDWVSRRLKFNEELKIHGSAAQMEKWQKDYFSGRSVNAPASHRTKVKVKPFKPAS
ncbi:MAG: hypothetical protein KGQ48_08945 [Bradyrhizobium sp.]|nr:hypothetical protein [Bradyrhizobium sp.]